MTEQATGASAPEASKTVVESAVRQALAYAAGRREKHGPWAGGQRLLLLRAAPQWRGPAALTVDAGGSPVTADIRCCSTVLAVLDALTEPREAETYLVVLTPCYGRELGNSVLARALGGEVRPIHRWDLVADAFGARKLDPRLTGRQFRWVAEALLDAQPGGGWRRITGPVLQFDTALQRLAAVRLGRGGEDERLDAAALLDWSRDETQVARFLALRQEEQDGLAGWLEESAGPVAQIVFRLLPAGQVTDAIPFGMAAAELYAPDLKTAAAGRRRAVIAARIRAEERFLGGQAPAEASLRVFGEAAESLTLRWSENGHSDDAQAMCNRAEQILRELGAGDVAGESRVLDAGIDARLAALAAGITAVLNASPAGTPQAGVLQTDASQTSDLATAETALERLREHRRYASRAAEVEAGAAAMRLLRWLAAAEPAPATVADGALRQVRSWAWADRALAVIQNANTARVPSARPAYAALYRAVKARRAAMDQAFAERLASWSPVAGVTEDFLLVENVLERIARPVAGRGAPLIIVLDGMSGAVACELAEDVTASRAWIEVGRHPEGREAALAAFPSATAFSRASLLCGELTSGAQPEERSGFAEFWKGREAVLFHKAGLSAGAGAVLNDQVYAAIGEPSTVVGVVLNTIDDALRDGREGSALSWRLADVTFLPELLSAAAAAGRPVILTSDHGHILSREDGVISVTSESARYREGEPGPGEVLIRGPRVLIPGGAVVLPWDERIRYTARKAGYHGGAALAEMVIPVLVFVPSAALCPRGWSLYETTSLHEPGWWNPGAGSRPPQPPAAPLPGRKPAKRPPAQEEALFSAEEFRTEEFGSDDIRAAPPTEVTLGARVVGSDLYRTQRAFVRKAPGDAVVAAIIDGLAEAGGKLPVSRAAELAGQPPFRMAGYLAQLGRLLNVDGYLVIGDADGGRTVDLNVRLLTEQFLGTL